MLLDSAMCIRLVSPSFFFFFFNDTATTEIYTLSLHDALPISQRGHRLRGSRHAQRQYAAPTCSDRKSTRLNSSHLGISYAVFCLKKKKKIHNKIQLKAHNKMNKSNTLTVRKQNN